MTDTPASSSDFRLDRSEDGPVRIECRLSKNTLWLTQVQLAELFSTSVPTTNQHPKAIDNEGKLSAQATMKSHFIVRHEGERQVSRSVKHAGLQAIAAEGKIAEDATCKPH
jgi:hypothetical protein